MDGEQFLYVLRATRLGMLTEGPTAEEAAVLQRHVAYLSALASEGRVLLFGRTQTHDADTRGIVIFRAPDEAAARALVDADPAVAGGVMLAELYPYKVAGYCDPRAFGL